MGPTAFATPPKLRSFLFIIALVLAREEAVVVPSAKAMLLDTNPLRDDDDDGDEVIGFGGVADMCNFAGA